MFEQIVIRRHDTERIIDPGALAETLLFYGRVHLLLDAGSLQSILKGVGTNNLVHLLKEKRVTATVLTDMMTTRTDTPGFGLPVYDFGAVSLAAHADGKKYKRKDLIVDCYERLLGDKRLARKKAETLKRHLKFRKQEENADEGICAQARADLQDSHYVRYAAEETLKGLIPNLVLPKNWHFEVVPANKNGFHIFTDLDFSYFNSVLGANNAITPAHLMTSVLDARADLNIASDYMAEMVTDPVRSKIIQRRFREFLSRRNVSAAEIGLFQDVNLSSARAIREAINSGERSFDEFLHVLDKAEKFKDWLGDVSPDAKLLDEYYQAVTAETWADKLPTKGARFAICSIAGLVLEALQPGAGGAALGIGVGAADLLWVDRILKGWRPSQFVNGPLKRFVVAE